ncbi:MAG: hypothetical protein EOM03_03475 [Clostridia bacterium]|nr:hypothetical protein [Clostridia bacterium]
MARYTHVTDPKGRLILPAKLRESLGSAVFVTNSLDRGYLAIYTEEQFDLIRIQLNSLPGTDPLARRLRRDIIGEACRTQPDSQGRISLTEELWQSIGVTAGDSVCLIDMGDSLQLCSERFYISEKEQEVPLSDLSLSDYAIRGIL